MIESIELKDFVLINKKDYENEIKSLDKQNYLSVGALQRLRTLKSILKKSIPVIHIASEAYEAGKKDKELSLMFDNPKGRFLNSKITFKK